MIKKLRTFYISILFLGMTAVVFSAEIQYTSELADGGIIYEFVPAAVNEGYAIGYSLFYPFADSRSSGTIGFDTVKNTYETLFVPDGASAVIYTIDSAKKTSHVQNLRPIQKIDENDIKILNPVSGVWNNMQTLALSLPEGTDVFYSYTDSDPLLSGFAYDKPVLIEKTGDVIIRLVAVTADNEKIEKTVSYTVNDVSSDISFFEMYRYDSCVTGGADNTMRLPAGSLYALGGDIEPYINARSLLLRGVMPTVEYMPITVLDNNNRYRAVLQLLPADIPAVRQTTDDSVPARMHNWYFLEFTPEEPVFFSFDTSAEKTWTLYTKPLIFNRQKEETVYWYSGNYKNGEVQNMHISLIPSVKVSASGTVNTGVDISLSTASYDIQYGDAPPVKSLHFDALYGSELSGVFPITAVQNGIIQGELPVSVSIDKKPPKRPALIANTKEVYSREDVVLSVKTEEGNTLFGSYDALTPAENYARIAVSHIILKGTDDLAQNYTVFVYAKDSAGNMSDIASYSVTIDKNNFYIDSLSALPSGVTRDGSKDRPFNDLEEAFRFAHERPLTRFFISGEFTVSTEVSVRSDVYIFGQNMSRITVNENAQITVLKGLLYMSDCIIEQSILPKTNMQYTSDFLLQPLFSVQDAALKIENCIISMQGGYSESFILSKRSSITLSRIVSAVCAQYYATFITASDSVIALSNIDSSVQAEAAEFISQTASRISSEDIHSSIQREAP